MDVMNVPDVCLFFCLSGFCKSGSSTLPHLCIFLQVCRVVFFCVCVCYSDGTGGLICSPWHSSLELTFSAGDYSLHLIRTVTVQIQGLNRSTTRQCNAQTDMHNTLLPTTLPTGSTVVVIKKSLSAALSSFLFFPICIKKKSIAKTFERMYQLFLPLHSPSP